MYVEGQQPEAVAPFLDFLARYPVSAWRASVLANLGQVYRQTGYLSRALWAWEQAWLEAKTQTDERGRAVADVALGEWLELTTKLGRVDPLAARIKEIEGRDVGGSAGAKVAAAREGLWGFQHQHNQAVGSGPLALDAILRTINGDSYSVPAELRDFHAAPAGMSLAELQALAKDLGLPMQIAARSRDAQLVVPSVIHLGVGHFSAIVKEEAGRYLLWDMVFGGQAWVSRDALVNETSGYFLVPEGPLPDSWRVVGDVEAATIIGHCLPGAPDPEDPNTCGTGPVGGPNCGMGGGGSGAGPRGGRGMPIYGFLPNQATLRLTDIPVGYTPPKGPAPLFQLVYHHREQQQPQIFSFWNTGPKWTLDWLSYVVDTPGSLGIVRVYLRGSGSEQYAMNSSDGVPSAPHWRTAATMVRTSTTPIRYERRLRDGGVEVFGQSDGAVGPGRRIFLTEVIDPRGQSLRFTYDASLRLVAATDALGQVTTLAYELGSDPLKVTKVTDPFGRFARFTYTPTGRLASITDVIGLTSSVTYGPADFVGTLTTPYGTTTFRHEPNPSGSETFRFVEATDPLGGTERLEFHWTTVAVPATAPAGQVPTGFAAYNADLDKYNTFYWDKRAWALYPGDVSKATITHWLLSNPGPLALHTYSSSVPHSVKRPLENRLWYAFQGQDPVSPRSVGTWVQPSKAARVLDDGASQITQATYNGHGMVASRTDPVGRRTSYVYAPNEIDVLEVRQTTGALNDLLARYANYTAQHLPQSVTDTAAQLTSYTYNTAGQVLTVTNPKLETTTNVYDPGGNGYLMSVTGPVPGATTSYTYDDYGRVRTITQADGYAVTTDYDLLDRVTRVTYPDTTYEQMIYDRLDLSQRRDRLGRITRHFYDPLRRQIASRDPLGRTVTQQWCSCGSLDKLIDAKAQPTTWERDVQNRVTREVRADSTTATTYAYEATTSRLRTVTDPKAQVTTYAYTVDDRVQQIAFTNAPIVTPSVNYTYDPNYARVATMADGSGTTTYAYKPAGVLGAGQLDSIDGPLPSDTISYSYDELGRGLSRLINGVGITQAYDALGRVTDEVNPLGTFMYTYEGVMPRLETVTYPNGQTSTYTYFDHLGDHRLQQIHHRYASTATLSKFDYTHDPTGNIKTWRQQADTTAVLWEYGYDTADQLTAATKKSTDPTPVVLKRYVYTYDPAGNRTTEQIDDSAMRASHDVLNRLVSQQPGGALRFAGTLNEPATVTIQGKPAVVTADNKFEGSAQVSAGTNIVSVVATDPNGNQRTNNYQVDAAGAGRTFTYDANGNLNSDGTRGFEWDAEDRLIAINQGTNRTEFNYDGMGRRVGIVEKVNGVTISDLRFLWCGAGLCEERSSSGAIVTKRFYAQGLESASTPYYDTRDHLGSVREMTDTTGAIRARYENDAFGRSIKIAGDIDTTFGFTGYYTHAPSNLGFTHYRVFDPTIARWLSRDPIQRVHRRFGTAPETGTNLYSYVSNNPVRWTDPDGLQAVALPTARALVTGWTIAACEPTPIGEIVMTILTILVAASATSGPPPNACDKFFDQCLSNPWQPEWNREQFGKKKDCFSCWRICKREGIWPKDKCPL